MLVFEERGKPEYPEKNLSEQSREPTNSDHIWRRVRESNPGHIGGRRALSPLRQPHLVGELYPLQAFASIFLTQCCPHEFAVKLSYKQYMKTYKFFPCLASSHELIARSNTKRGSIIIMIVVMSDISMLELLEWGVEYTHKSS